MKRILIDRHHAGLFYSLQLLGARLDWEVWTPVGHGWWDEGYWAFGRDSYQDGRLRDQYLTIDEAWTFAPKGMFGYMTFDPEFPQVPIFGIDLDTARSMEWDYVMATVQENQHGLARFAREHGARYLYQVGNTGQQIDWGLYPTCLVSSEMPIEGVGIRYHQEMDPAFRWYVPLETRVISSFINFATHNTCWPLAPQLWSHLPEHEWLLYGGGMPDGVVKPAALIAEKMAASGWAYHDKPTGDGFGHVLWGWAAVGRPLIGHASHYDGKLGEVLWEDGVTCIDLDRHDIEEAADLIIAISDDEERHEEMCRAIRAAFDAHYDPERDARAIAQLLGA